MEAAIQDINYKPDFWFQHHFKNISNILKHPIQATEGVEQPQVEMILSCCEVNPASKGPKICAPLLMVSPIDSIS
jgi:hypothetical protein